MITKNKINQTIKEELIDTNQQFYLNPRATTLWKSFIVNELNRQKIVSLKDYNHTTGNSVIFKKGTLTYYKKRISNALGIGYTPKSAYENAITFIREDLKSKNIVLNKNNNNFQAHLWTTYLDVNTLICTVVKLDQHKKLYIIKRGA